MSKSDCSIDMTLCPECVQYIRHCLGESTLECPFCDTRFAPDDVAGTAPSASAVPSGLKTGVMAASFVGATMLGGVACGASDQPEYGVPVPDDAGFNVSEPDADAGGTDDTGSGEDTGDDVAHVQPEYGGVMPPDVGMDDEPDAGGADTSETPDASDDD